MVPSERASKEFFNQKDASQHSRPSPSLPASHPFFVFAAALFSGPFAGLSLSFLLLLLSAVIPKPLHGHPPRKQGDSGGSSGHVTALSGGISAYIALHSSLL